MYNRLISLPKQRSFFLFGQRGTGKSFLLRQLYDSDSSLYINLLDSRQFLFLSKEPWQLRKMAAAMKKSQEIIIIDEIQKIPELLDEVHLLIEEEGKVFGLTGSSARKLKAKGTNLLAGRALSYRLYPLSAEELGDDFDLDSVLQWGSLPGTCAEGDRALREEYLYSYVDTYLKEEILQEQIVRDLEPFSRFLEVSAQGNADLVSLTNVAKDIKVSVPTVKNYYQILEDTLLGFFLHPYHKSLRKRYRQAPKFYFYDLGLLRALQNTVTNTPVSGTFEYGMLFESFVVNEIVRLNEYSRARYSLSFLRLDNDKEIDLIVERPGKKTLLIEIKSRNTIDERHLNSLIHLLPDFPNAQPLCLAQVQTRMKVDSVLVLPWREGISEIFAE